MTAPRTLPGCPVCGKAPMCASMPRLYERSCIGWSDDGYTDHKVYANGSSKAEADARWRRLAGAKP